MKIAVLSDTHGLLRPEAAKEDAPIYIVRGNNDKEWAEHLPHHLEFKTV